MNWALLKGYIESGNKFLIGFSVVEQMHQYLNN